MNDSENLQINRSIVRLYKVSIFTFWILAFAVWWLCLWHIGVYTKLGIDIPQITISIIWSTELGLPFILATLFTVIVILQVRKAKERVIVEIVCWLLIISILCVSFTILGLSAPMLIQCGEFIPRWPDEILLLPI